MYLTKEGHNIHLRVGVDLCPVTPPSLRSLLSRDIRTNWGKPSEARITASTILLGSVECRVAKRHLSTSIANYDINTRAAGGAMHAQTTDLAHKEVESVNKLMTIKCVEKGELLK